jgi:CheY-like chemotaxis protein
MPNSASGWLFAGEAREETDRAIAECVREHGGSLDRSPTVIMRAMVRNDGTEVEVTAVFVNDEDGWWEKYARIHGWPKYTNARVDELLGEKEPEPSDSDDGPQLGRGAIDMEMTTGSPTLLVADDEWWVREPTALMLKRAGYKILMTGDSWDTVAVFQQYAEEIVAVLLDCHMPGGRGEEVFEELQRIRPDVPVIMMSGYDEERIMGRFMGMGIVGFLQKPFGRVTLIDKVREALEPPAA